MPLIFRKSVATLLAFALIFSVVSVGANRAEARSLPLIRDAEIEGLMRLYTKEIFKAAGLKPGAVRIHLINHPSINAFVAEGQRDFHPHGFAATIQNTK